MQAMSLFAKKGMNSAPEFSRIKHPKYMTIDDRINNWIGGFKNKLTGFVMCPKCGKTLLNDNNILQNHMMKVHVRDRASNKGKMFRFHPTGKPNLGESAYNVAKNKDSREKQWS